MPIRGANDIWFRGIQVKTVCIRKSGRHRNLSSQEDSYEGHDRITDGNRAGKTRT